MIRTSPLRKYQQVWNLLRDSPSHRIKLSAAPNLHPRIKKAVIKEKDLDVVYKLQMADNYSRSRLWFTSSGNVLSITLTISLGLTDTDPDS